MAATDLQRRTSKASPGCVRRYKRLRLVNTNNDSDNDSDNDNDNGATYPYAPY